MNKKKLKAKCVEKGYTDEQLAKKINIGRTTMSYKINQHKPFKQNEMKEIMEILGLDPVEMTEIFFED
jgi:DNA-binding helix-turn-helix protein